MPAGQLHGVFDVVEHLGSAETNDANKAIENIKSVGTIVKDILGPVEDDGGEVFSSEQVVLIRSLLARRSNFA